jgi:hypothetical protein
MSISDARIELETQKSYGITATAKFKSYHLDSEEKAVLPDS